LTSLASRAARQARHSLNEHLKCCPLLSVNRKVLRADVLIMLVVSLLVVATNIVVAVGIGLGLSAIVFAWNAAKQLEVTAYTTKDDNGKPLKIYEVAGQLFFAATHRFPDYFSPEDDPVHVVVTFSNGGHLFDYTIMDAVVALSAAYKAEGKRIEFRSLQQASVKMLQKASYWTRNVEYTMAALTEHKDHALPEEAGAYSRAQNSKRRITGLAAPSWSDAAGPGIYELAPTSQALTAPSTPYFEPTEAEAAPVTTV